MYDHVCHLGQISKKDVFLNCLSSDNSVGRSWQEKGLQFLTRLTNSTLPNPRLHDSSGLFLFLGWIQGDISNQNNKWVDEFGLNHVWSESYLQLTKQNDQH